MRTAIPLLGALAMTMPPQSPSSGTVVAVYRDFRHGVALDTFHVDRCGAGTGPNQVLPPATPPEEIASLVRALDAAGVQQIAERSLARASSVLPGATVTICLYPGDIAGSLQYLGGVGGVSLGGGRIKLFLHPKPGQLRRVTYAVAHEYHHEVERLRGDGSQRPLDIMIREGKADHFATGLYPELRPPHTERLSATDFETAWKEFKGYQSRQVPPSEFRAAFMIGRNTRVLPWPGYRLGYELVESYFRAHPMPPAKAITVRAQAIFDYFAARGRG